MSDIAHGGAHGAEHAHAHDPNLQHHFETHAQQFDASKLGMWLFLAQEVLFFSGLFCAYVIYRSLHPEIFRVGHQFLDPFWGGLNTVVLILSSFTMAMGVWCAQKSYQRGLVWCLALTLLGAFGFMVVKTIEYSDKFAHGKVWGPNFRPHHDAAHDAAHDAGAAHAGEPHAAKPDAHPPEQPGAAAPPGAVAPPENKHPLAHPESLAHETQSTSTPAASQSTATSAPAREVSTILSAAIGPAGLTAAPPAAAAHGGAHGGVDPYEAAKQMKDLQIFMAIYFCMTGLHGLHVVAGIIMLIWLLNGAIRGRYHSGYYTPVDLGGLYWHLVDLVWIYLFPMFYLIH